MLAAAAAARLVTRLVDLQAAGTTPKIVLTGGGIGIAMLEQLRATVARDAVDWGQVEFYWGDERFLPPGDPERNETQARAALLDHVPVDPAKVFPMGADTGTGPAGAEAAAEEYAEAAPARGPARGPRPGAVVRRAACSAWAARGTPRRCSRTPPPSTRPSARSWPCTAARSRRPTRVSLTLPAIRRAAEVWIMTTGESKAAAVAMALSGAGEVAIPVAGAQGRRRTRWLLDRAAAAKLPRDLVPPIG